MIRFACTPRHPVTQVAFTADGAELVTAQPHVGVVVRDRLSGVGRWSSFQWRTPAFRRLLVHPSLGWIDVHPPHRLFDPATGAVPRAAVRDGPSGPISPAATLDGASMWWRGSPDGDAVSVEFRPRGSPLAARRGRTVALDCGVRARHFASAHLVFTFAPDGTKVALGDGETVSVFDLAPLDADQPAGRARPTLEPLFTLDRPDPTRHGTHADKTAEHWLPPVAFDHAGRTLLTLGLRNRVQRIDLATGGVTAEWGWRCEPVRSLAVSPDDLTAAAGCRRGEVVLWDLE